MTAVAAGPPGRRVLVARPDGADAGMLSIDIAVSLIRARQEHADLYLLDPLQRTCDELLALEPEGVRRIAPGGARGFWLRARWRAARMADALEAGAASGGASFWIEIYRELRRHAGDERMPFALRGRLRERARSALTRSEDGRQRTQARPFPRRLLRERVATAFPAAMFEAGRARAAALGVALDRPLVTLEIRTATETFHAAVDALVADGYTVVRIGDSIAGPLRRAGIVDLACVEQRSPVLELLALLSSAFVVCESPHVQRMAYLTNTPSLLLNAVEPFAAYPVREDGLFTLATAVDLETGATLAPSAQLTEAFLRNVHRYGHRSNSAGEVLDAVREIQQGLREGWRDSVAQSRFREQAIDAGTTLAGTIPRVAAWGPDTGFLGDGRLARVQAERESAA